MKAEKKTITKHDCKRCGHSWWPRIAKVLICPHCKSPRWREVRAEKAAKVA